MDRDALILLLLVLAVTAASSYAAYDHYRQRAEHRPVEATITHSETWEAEYGTVLDVEYRYTVDGETYNGTNVCPSTVSEGGCYGSPEEVVRRYPEGTTVTAYVDPDRPSEAYLIRGGTPYPLLFFAGVGALFSLFMLRQLVAGGDPPDWKRE